MYYAFHCSNFPPEGGEGKEGGGGGESKNGGLGMKNGNGRRHSKDDHDTPNGGLGAPSSGRGVGGREDGGGGGGGEALKDSKSNGGTDKLMMMMMRTNAEKLPPGKVDVKQECLACLTGVGSSSGTGSTVTEVRKPNLLTSNLLSSSFCRESDTSSNPFHPTNDMIGQREGETIHSTQPKSIVSILNSPEQSQNHNIVTMLGNNEMETTATPSRNSYDLNPFRYSENPLRNDDQEPITVPITSTTLSLPVIPQPELPELPRPDPSSNSVSLHTVENDPSSLLWRSSASFASSLVDSNQNMDDRFFGGNQDPHYEEIAGEQESDQIYVDFDPISPTSRSPFPANSDR